MAFSRPAISLPPSFSLSAMVFLLCTSLLILETRPSSVQLSVSIFLFGLFPFYVSTVPKSFLFMTLIFKISSFICLFSSLIF